MAAEFELECGVGAVGLDTLPDTKISKTKNNSVNERRKLQETFDLFS